MRRPLHPKAEQGRIIAGEFATNADSGCNGAFRLRRKRRDFFLIISDGNGWEHVSVSMLNEPDKTPTWKEMCWIKDLFWNEDEWVVQYHPAKHEYINEHIGALHLWRSIGVEIPHPPLTMV